MKKVIYDVGANNGDDIPYYLMKGDVVIAVEANPVLCDLIKNKFAVEIQNRRVFVECCVITDKSNLENVNFYLHKSNHVLSRFTPPDSDESKDFDVVKLPSRSIMEVIAQYGMPYYIKLDVEFYEVSLLKTLFANNIRPPFISAESQTWEVFDTLIVDGHYKLFKLVDGSSVSARYKNRLIKNDIVNSDEEYSFPYHSAGPFGNDVDGDWMTSDELKNILLVENVGWKDIHAAIF